MSYVKLFTTVQDHAVGQQSVVQAIDNNAALLTAFDAKHSIGIGGESPYGFPAKALGRHDDILIARSVADFEIDNTTTTTRLKALVSGHIFGSLVYSRLAAGQWQILIATPQLFGAVALMKSTASVDYKANCYRVSSTTTGANIIVSTWNVNSGGTAALADLPFSLVVWTEIA